MITSIIFSKNRPLQLDLCLNSIKKNFPQSTQNIVIHNNSVEFGKAHNQLIKEHPDVKFWQQSKWLFFDVWDAVTGAKNDYVCLFVDDCIVYNKIEIEEINKKLIPEVSCISLRLGANICERQHEGETFPDKPQSFAFSECGKYMVWNKTTRPYGSYWSYSLSVDGHIFRKDELEEMTYELYKVSNLKDWKQTPNELESQLQRFWALSPPLMVCPFQSAVVNSPNNKVQDTHTANRAGDVFSYCEYDLLENYLCGDRINIDKIEDYIYNETDGIKCPHTEINLERGLK
jgi:hypothetical protein